MIEIEKNVIRMSGEKYSYVIELYEGKPMHRYFGEKLSSILCAEDFQDTEEYEKGFLTAGRKFTEYGEFGRGDFRTPSIAVHGKGFCSTDLSTVGVEILKQKPASVMPVLRDGGETLKIVTEDKVSGIRLTHYYTPYEEGLCRRTEFTNIGKTEIVLDKLMSACIDFPKNEYKTLDLSGKWAGERQIVEREVFSGNRQISSVRGASSHQQNPFIAIALRDTTEDKGEAFGFNLVYSGNFLIETEMDEKQTVRLQIGLNVLHGGFTIGVGETFVAPEAVLVYGNGYGEMSRNFHDLYRKHLINPKYQDVAYPIVLNSWESMYFDFNEEKFLDFIEEAKGLGVDTIVMDDGWFGARDNDASSLGDWFVDGRKFPNGLKKVIDACHKNGMRFGIWFEPEMISPKSELYTKKPQWCLHTEGRVGKLGRNQYNLDFSKKEIVDYVYKQICTILDEYDISYVKWDMNRLMSDVPNAITYHKYVLGVYDLYTRLTTRYPDVFIEGCAGGGGRFDPAILYYSPMIWTSDNTDAYMRTRIQYGTSLCYPLSTMSNHVSACPNHQTGRITPLETRYAVASLGRLGYELNPKLLSNEERERICGQIERYKKDRELLVTGDLYRLVSPFVSGDFSEIIVSKDKKNAYVAYVAGLYNKNSYAKKLRLKGLVETAMYFVEEENKRYTGEFLMRVGLTMRLEEQDFAACVWHLSQA